MRPQRQASVLLVDDQPENLVALSAVLEPLGQDLVHASSGEEALKLLLKQEFALILLDVQMPGLDGFETAALIKQREKTRHVPIIFVTAISKDTEHIFRGYSEGAVDYLLKPYDPAVLRSKVSVFVQLYQKSAALEDSEQRFRTAFANAPSGMALMSPEGRWLQVNSALAEMVGRSQAELIGSLWDSIFHPEERVAARDALRELVRDERPVHRAERRCLHTDGRLLLVAVSLSPMARRGAREAQLIVQLEDVTGREQAERERAERIREQAARAEAEALANMVRNLQSVSDTALAHLALDDLLPELLDRVREILGAELASILLADQEQEELVLRAARGLAESGDELRIPIGRGSLAGRVAKDRRPAVIADARDGGSENLDESLRASGVRSLMAVPLIAEGQVGGVVCVGSLTPGRFDDNDVALLALVADRAALAIGNARLYEREHRIVETLQRSLLPDRLPRLPGMHIAARYMPGGADVGGDWFDAIDLQNGGIGIVMGDVVGHGIGAASLMGQLRNAMRAYALEELSPSEVVARLDRLVQQLEGGHMATLMYAVIEPDWSRVRFTSAGHPPLLVLGPDGRAEYLWGGRSTPLGSPDHLGYEEDAAELEGGSTLVLYTDGLVEVRGEPLDVGLERLSQEVVNGPREPEALCDHVIDSLLGSGPASDDVALLALRTTPLSPEQLRLELPTTPTALLNVRRTLGRWLERAGASAEDKWAISLACHEACANAIEHAYGFGEALFELEASLSDGELRLLVRDGGTWQEPGRGSRGQGIPLMRALMDGVRVDGGPDGTVVELRRRLGDRTRGGPSARPGREGATPSPAHRPA
jgi:PAS domain S-box-containing protein